MQEVKHISGFQKNLSGRLEEALHQLGLEGEVVGIEPGLVVTKYIYCMTQVHAVDEFLRLGNDLSEALNVSSARVAAYNLKQHRIAIELPNPQVEKVLLREILDSSDFKNHLGRLPFVLGRDFSGKAVIGDLTHMPNLWLAGCVCSGKSLFMKTLLLSLLSRFSPTDLRLILVDTKKTDFMVFNDLPHLYQKIVTNPRKAVEALEWMVEEKLRRHKLFSVLGVRNLDGYNRKLERLGDSGAGYTANGLKHAPLPVLVLCVDEMSDLMKLDSDAVELAIAHLAPYGGPVGIHFVVASQRTSPEVFSGLLKPNIPSRVCFKVYSRLESSRILDKWGAETLMGFGDMLFLPPASNSLERLHSAFVSRDEISEFVYLLKEQN
jgi:S-DNA-T family DNA segregation ATPase FtsK/SpoIIIE